MYENDTKTSTVSKIPSKNVTNNKTNDIESCISSNNLQDQLINIMIEGFLDLRSLNLPQNKIHLKQNEKPDNIYSSIARDNLKDLVNGINERSTFDLKNSGKQKPKKLKKSKRKSP